MRGAPGDSSAANSGSCRVLVLSDGKPGHFHQSVAFAKHLGCQYSACRVRLRNRFFKGVSYVFDRLGIRSSWLFDVESPVPDCDLVVSAGSDTYYANRVLSRRLKARSVAVMLPRGYRYGFDLILAQQHDDPPRRKNIVALPVNLSAPEPMGLVKPVPGRKVCIAVVIGGPSRHYRFDCERLAGQLARLFELFPDGDFLVTTSRRTPPEADALLESLPFRYRLLYSRERGNPVPDFLAIADYVFITEDSTSMVSEAVTFGQAKIEILPVEHRAGSPKVASMIDALALRGCLHRFDGSLGEASEKIVLDRLLDQAVPRRWLRPSSDMPKGMKYEQP